MLDKIEIFGYAHSHISPHEEKIFNNRFPDCRKLEGRCDVMFVYSDEFQGNICETANALQAMTGFLKYVTCLNPVQFFNSRIMVGYNKNALQANWSGEEGNRIHIPWQDEYFEQDELLDSCSHELVHPFFRVSALHCSNQWWGEGFCDFLRGPIKDIAGLDGKGWWKKKIEQARSNKQDRGGNIAGQLVLRAQEEQRGLSDINQFIAQFINDREAIRSFVGFLFDRFSHRSMGEEFLATEWIREKSGDV